MYANNSQSTSISSAQSGDFELVSKSKCPHCPYPIPFVFKPCLRSEVTLFLGCERFEIKENETIIRIYYPYVYLNKKKEWFRIIGFAHKHLWLLGFLEHISFIFNMTPGEMPSTLPMYDSHEYPKIATKLLRQLHFPERLISKAHAQIKSNP